MPPEKIELQQWCLGAYRDSTRLVWEKKPLTYKYFSLWFTRQFWKFNYYTQKIIKIIFKKLFFYRLPMSIFQAINRSVKIILTTSDKFIFFLDTHSSIILRRDQFRIAFSQRVSQMMTQREFISQRNGSELKFFSCFSICFDTLNNKIVFF